MVKLLTPTFEPTFEVAENMAPDIVDSKIGQGLKMLVNYEVIEKTKSFVVLRINSLSLQPSRRKL